MRVSDISIYISQHNILSINSLGGNNPVGEIPVIHIDDQEGHESLDIIFNSREQLEKFANQMLAWCKEPY